MSLSRPILSGIIALLLISCNNNEDRTPSVAGSRSTIAEIQKAVQQYPDSMLLVQELIQAYHQQGNYDSAIVITQRSIDRDTGNSYLWNVMASLRFETGDTTGAILSLKHAIAVYPLPEYFVALGTIYAEVKNKSSLAIADRLIEDPSNKNKDDGYFIKGLYYNYTDQPAQAIPYLDTCLSLNYTYMYAYREKGIALYDLEKYADAIKVLDRAITLKNSYDEGYYWMGKAYEKLNKKDSAINCYQFALLYDKDYAEAQDALNRLTKK